VLLQAQGGLRALALAAQQNDLFVPSGRQLAARMARMVYFPRAA
jgi:hypothetical protein